MDNPRDMKARQEILLIHMAALSMLPATGLTFSIAWRQNIPNEWRVKENSELLRTVKQKQAKNEKKKSYMLEILLKKKFSGEKCQEGLLKHIEMTRGKKRHIKILEARDTQRLKKLRLIPEQLFHWSYWVQSY